MADEFTIDEPDMTTAPGAGPAEILDLTRQLLTAIANGDWRTYERLCAADITCFEPEARGHLVEGLPFHQFYFNLGGHIGPLQTTLAAPKVRMLGPDAALIAYVRLVQAVGGDGQPGVRASEETRLWQRVGGAWKHVHFHRSPAP